MAKRRKKSPQKTPKLKPHNYIKKVARKLPIHECLVLDNWKENGITPVIISRKKSNGNIVLGGYIVDIWCLGVKNTYFNHDMFPSDYESYKNQLSGDGEMGLEKITPNFAFNLIYGAVEYAEDIGFSPHKDFKITEYILDDVETVEYEEIEFGKDGKPFYVSGPYDNTNYIMGVLGKNVGQDNFDFISEVQDPSFSDTEEDQFLEELIEKDLPRKKRDKIFNNLKTDEEKAIYKIQTFIAEGLVINFEGNFEDLPANLDEEIYENIMYNAESNFFEGEEMDEETIKLLERSIIVLYRKLRKYKSFDFLMSKDYLPSPNVLPLEKINSLNEYELIEYFNSSRRDFTLQDFINLLLYSVTLVTFRDVSRNNEDLILSNDDIDEVVNKGVSLVKRIEDEEGDLQNIMEEIEESLRNLADSINEERKEKNDKNED